MAGREILHKIKASQRHELGLDCHLSHVLPDYLKENLFNNILNESNIWTEPENVIRKANGVAKQLSVDHEPASERENIENRGGFISNFPGDGCLQEFKETSYIGARLGR
ncbi:hypothetical protein V6N13_121600 [Hibiscus sabdariffa]|uniref:Uncharacterized protein n=1 Tax=Hibiscus sabdariffa TaxID=183260 RepID=A0ABR2PDM1_9ROSI